MTVDVSAVSLLFFFVASFAAAVLGGIAGAGGGFIVTPLLVFLGLSPAQAVSTSKCLGLSIAVGSLRGLKTARRGSRRRLILIMAMASIVGLLAPLIIVQLDSEVYRRLLGGFLIVMAPVLILKKVGRTGQGQKPIARRVAGYTLLAVSLALQGVFSSGMGSLVNIVMMLYLGMDALEANVTKRYSQILLNTLVIVGVLFSGLIVWQYAVAGMLAAGAGGYVGGRLAVRRGNSFVMGVFVVTMLASGLALLFG